MDYNAEILETDSVYLMLATELVFIAKKADRKEAKM